MFFSSKKPILPKLSLSITTEDINKVSTLHQLYQLFQIWYISTTDTGSVNLEVAADLTRHQKAVNVVRWSPNGQFLASGDDESIIFIWKKTDKEPAPVMDQSEEQYKESWVIHKVG